MYKIKKLLSFKKEINIPSDKSISHRALILSSICKEKTIIKSFLSCDDTFATLDCMKRLGVGITTKSDGTIIVNGVGKYFPKNEKVKLYAGESGTTMRILSGLLCAQKFPIEFNAAAGLNCRPMGRIIKPLRKMNADIVGQAKKNNDPTDSGEFYPPLNIKPSKKGIKGKKFNMPIASAQVKSAIMLAALYAKEETVIRESYISRDHTERMLKLFGGNLKRNGREIIYIPSDHLKSPGQLQIPSDFSSAAFFIVLGLILENTEIRIKNVNINPTRFGLLHVLNRMGANITLEKQIDYFEPYADMVVRSSKLSGTNVKASEIPSMIDEIPILCVAAAFAKGQTNIYGVGELRVKETNRLNSIFQNLTKAGVNVRVNVNPNDSQITVVGTSHFRPATFKSFNDHRSAMSAIILGSASGVDCKVNDIQCVNKSFPEFTTLFESL